MTEAPERPRWRTGILWALLAGFLIVGAAAAATFVYGLLGFAAGSLLGLGFAALGGLGTVLAMLFTLGILYRVDRYRGAAMRRVELFE